jgi:hypothetical protein
VTNIKYKIFWHLHSNLERNWFRTNLFFKKIDLFKIKSKISLILQSCLWIFGSLGGIRKMTQTVTRERGVQNVPKIYYVFIEWPLTFNGLFYTDSGENERSDDDCHPKHSRKATLLWIDHIAQALNAACRAKL